LPDVYGDQLARAAKLATATASASTPRPLVAAALEASLIMPDGRDAAVKRGLDAFREAATPTYHVPGEGDFQVATAFRMPGCTGNEKSLEANVKERNAIAARYGIDTTGATFGRLHPEGVRRLTQALIDSGKLPPGSAATAPRRIRQMMFDYGVGLDCAAYAQQAFLAASGVTRAQAGFAPQLQQESLSHLGPPFSRVAPEGVRPGDIVVLEPPPDSRAAGPGGQPVGHRAVVYDSRGLSPKDVEAVASRVRGVDPTAARLSVVMLDSSWGASQDASRGGVSRRTFLYDASSGKWAQDHGGALFFGVSPYAGDRLQGIYRFPVKP
jgi:hypothetical protein